MTTYAADTFTRSQSNSWGTADTGGSWTITGNAAYFNVDGSEGHMDQTAGYTCQAKLGSVSVRDQEIVVDLIGNDSAVGGGYYWQIDGRWDDTNYYGVRVRGTTSNCYFELRGNNTTLGTSYTIKSSALSAGERVRVKLQLLNASPTTIRAKCWRPDSESEPTSWQRSSDDSSNGPQVAGSPRLLTYLSGTFTGGADTSWDNLTVEDVATTVEATADLSWGGLSVAANAVVPIYALANLSWGGLSVTASANISSPTVVQATANLSWGGLLVTADGEITNAIALDTFTRTVGAGGWGTADIGGTWTPDIGVSYHSVNGSKGLHTLNAGQESRAELQSVSALDQEMLLDIDGDTAAAGGGYYWTFGVRSDGSSFYGGRIRVAATTPYVYLNAWCGSGQISGTSTIGIKTGSAWSPGEVVRVKLYVEGSSPTIYKIKAWLPGSESEPSFWDIEVEDSTSGPQIAGFPFINTYISGTFTDGAVTYYDNLSIQPVTPPAPVTGPWYVSTGSGLVPLAAYVTT